MREQDFYNQYQLGKRLSSEPVVSYEGHDVDGLEVMVHFLQGSAEHTAGILSRLLRLHPRAKGQLLGVVALRGVNAIVTTRIQRFASFGDWIETACDATGPFVELSPPEVITATIPPGDAEAPGEFTRLFGKEDVVDDAEHVGGDVSDEVDVDEVAARRPKATVHDSLDDFFVESPRPDGPADVDEASEEPADVDEASEEPADVDEASEEPAATRGDDDEAPGEFTRLFGKGREPAAGPAEREPEGNASSAEPPDESEDILADVRAVPSKEDSYDDLFGDDADTGAAAAVDEPVHEELTDTEADDLSEYAAPERAAGRRASGSDSETPGRYTRMFEGLDPAAEEKSEPEPVVDPAGRDDGDLDLRGDEDDWLGRLGERKEREPEPSPQSTGHDAWSAPAPSGPSEYTQIVAGGRPAPEPPAPGPAASAAPSRPEDATPKRWPYVVALAVVLIIAVTFVIVVALTGGGDSEGDTAPPETTAETSG